MKDLEKTLEIMEGIYNKKLSKIPSPAKNNYYLSKIDFIQNLRLVLWASDNMDKFIENMNLKE